jgi:transcriptional regulator with XRE-family HTH domain
MTDTIGLAVPVEIKPRTELGRRILQRIKDLGLDVTQSASRIYVKYETLRKVVKGDRPPPRRLLRDLCRELNLDFQELETIVVVDKLRQEHPAALLHIAGVAEPEIIAIARQWPSLSDDQKQHIRWLVAKFVEENAPNTTLPGIELTERKKPQ